MTIGRGAFQRQALPVHLIQQTHRVQHTLPCRLCEAQGPISQLLPVPLEYHPQKLWELATERLHPVENPGPASPPVRFRVSYIQCFSRRLAGNQRASGHPWAPRPAAEGKTRLGTTRPCGRNEHEWNDLPQGVSTRARTCRLTRELDGSWMSRRPKADEAPTVGQAEAWGGLPGLGKHCPRVDWCLVTHGG